MTIDMLLSPFLGIGLMFTRMLGPPTADILGNESTAEGKTGRSRDNNRFPSKPEGGVPIFTRCLLSSRLR